uniref:Uncharacterized protein n=1 Tax=Thermosporothrix sp. COM3 TaxID=2490863 RepID=A0A455SH90_9CHLR|nr:hypothetical protein KTC_18670 [Thermosporothrix sp. COM3]
MYKYCKAYRLAELRQFRGWIEQPTATPPDADTICYLCDDFTVVLSPVQEQAPLFAKVTPEWREFCQETLHFAIPEDLQYAYQADA